MDQLEHLTTAKCHRCKVRNEAVRKEYENRQRNIDWNFRPCSVCVDSRQKLRNSDDNAATNIRRLLTREPDSNKRVVIESRIFEIRNRSWRGNPPQRLVLTAIARHPNVVMHAHIGGGDLFLATQMHFCCGRPSQQRGLFPFYSDVEIGLGERITRRKSILIAYPGQSGSVHRF